MKRVMLKNIELGKENKVAGFVENIRNKKDYVLYSIKGCLWKATAYD